MNAAPIAAHSKRHRGPSSPHAIPGSPLSPSTPIIGRDFEIAEISERLDRGDHRLLTLLGPGGVGKTRLAHEIARLLGPNFAHGAAFVPLDSIRDPDLVPLAVARTLGIWEQSDTPIETLLLSHLADRHMLLVLDNMEQVVGAAPSWLADFILRAPRVHVLVTSRVPLNIEVEQRYVVPPLPTDGNDPSRSAAVTLFAARAKAVNDRFEMNEQIADVVAEICRQLDGLPLAIELAAARSRMLSPPELLNRLTNRLEILTGGHEDAPKRLRSMRAAIQWSTELLSPDQLTLFRRLSAFVDGFSLEAAGYVATWPKVNADSLLAIDLLQSLLDHSLVYVVPGLPTSRYRMLETVREYALELAVRSGDVGTHVGHADYVRDLARRAEGALMGPDQALWLDQLESEYANIQTAISWLSENGRVDDSIEIYAQLCPFIDLRGHTPQALRHLETWMEEPDVRNAPHAKGLLLATMGTLLHNTGDFQRAADLLGEAVDLLRSAGDHYRAVLARSFLGIMYAFTEEFDLMRSTLESAIEDARSLGHHRALATCYLMLAEHAWLTGDDVHFRHTIDRGMEVARNHGDWWVLSFGLLTLSNDALIHGRMDDVERYTRESLRIRTELGSKRDMPADLMSLGWIARERGDIAQAEAHLSTALTIAEETGHDWYQVLVWFLQGTTALQRGDLAQARACLLRHLLSFETHQRLDHLALSMSAHAAMACTSGEASIAARFLGAAEAFRTHLVRPDPIFVVETATIEARLRIALGERAFSAQYAVGNSWSIDEAMNEALCYEPAQMDPGREVAARALPPTLSPREKEVLNQMAKGLSNREIADALFVSHRTVTTHVTNILTKLNVDSRTAAVSFAIRSGLV